MSTPPNLEQWQNLEDIIQFMWHPGDIPMEMGWTILVLIPKGNTDTQGTGILGSRWKVVEVIIYTHLVASVRLHGVLHGFHTGRGTETATLEIKMEHELDSIDQDIIFLVFLDIQNVYNTVDWGRLLTTL